MNDTLILCYHAVSERWTSDLSVTPRQLERQLRIILGRGYRPVTFTQAVTAAPAGKTLAVTFDDAYRSVLALAFPIMSRLGVPGSVFAVTGSTSAGGPMSWPGIDMWLGGPHQQELIPMSWTELGSLAAAGWEVGSHTRTHPRLPELGQSALTEELRGSRQDCEERLGARCLSLAYPYGAVDQRVVEATRAAGYLAAAGLPGRMHPARTHEWPRVGVYHGDDERRFRLKASRALRTFRASPAGAVLDLLARR